MEGRREGRMEGREDGRKGGWKEGRMEGREDGREDGEIQSFDSDSVYIQHSFLQYSYLFLAADIVFLDLSAVLYGHKIFQEDFVPQT
jgi:hypothetical protein